MTKGPNNSTPIIWLLQDAKHSRSARAFFKNSHKSSKNSRVALNTELNSRRLKSLYDNNRALNSFHARRPYVEFGLKDTQARRNKEWGGAPPIF